MNGNYFLDKLTIILKDFFKQILIILLYIFLSLGLQLLFIKELKSNNLLMLNVINILIELIILTIFILIFRKQLIPDFDDFKKNGNNYLEKYFSYYVIGLIIMLITNKIINYFIDIPTNELLNRNIMFKMPFYSIMAMVICAPIVEECMTRGILKDTFNHPFLYYLSSGLIFGGLHLLKATKIAEVFFLIPYGTLGFTFAIMYKKSNNIWTNIFFHSLHNLIAILIIFRSL